MASASSERTARLPQSVALHARPAGELVRMAAGFDAEIVVGLADRVANAKSILEILSLGAEGGSELRIAASGEDAAAAVDRLAALVADLGE